MAVAELGTCLARNTLIHSMQGASYVAGGFDRTKRDAMGSR